jgi:outer membrane protein assembly factor BamA
VVGVDVPVWDDFHIGGTNTVRGWTYGARVGKDQSIATIEYRFLLLDPKLVQFRYLKMDMGIQLAAFVDAGTAWNTEEKPIDEFISGFGMAFGCCYPPST